MVAKAIDVLIVGAGAAGCLLAAVLSEGGKRVIVLESGPPWQGSDMVSSQIWARRLKWGGSPVLAGGKDPFGHNVMTGWGYGGSALHHYGGWPRLHAEDFRVRSMYGRGRDWPISYEDLRPFYDRIQTEVGIAGDAKAEIGRPPGEPYPLPPMVVFRQGDLIAKGFSVLGKTTAPYPSAILSKDYKGRVACPNDGWCAAGCPTMSIANPLAIYMPRAIAAGAKFRSGCTVTRIVTGRGGRVTGAEFVDETGRRNSLSARLTILAGGAVQNARLLLNTPVPGRTSSLANRSGLVGRAIHAHSLAINYAMFEEETQCYMGTTSAQLTCLDDYAKSRPGKPFGSIAWAIAHAVKPNDLLGICNTRPEIFGSALHAFLDRSSRHIATLDAICEEIPEDTSRIELVINKDRLGVPLARVVHTLNNEALELRAEATRQASAILKAAGSSEHWSAPPVSIHLAGGTIMGADPADSVTDSYGRCHEVPNLLVAGSSLFPTSGAVNPNFTIHALALRSAEYLLAHWHNYTD